MSVGGNEIEASLIVAKAAGVMRAYGYRPESERADYVAERIALGLPASAREEKP